MDDQTGIETTTARPKRKYTRRKKADVISESVNKIAACLNDIAQAVQKSPIEGDKVANVFNYIQHAVNRNRAVCEAVSQQDVPSGEFNMDMDVPAPEVVPSVSPPPYLPSAYPPGVRAVALGQPNTPVNLSDPGEMDFIDED